MSLDAIYVDLVLSSVMKTYSIMYNVGFVTSCHYFHKISSLCMRKLILARAFPSPQLFCTSCSPVISEHRTTVANSSPLQRPGLLLSTVTESHSIPRALLPGLRSLLSKDHVDTREAVASRMLIITPYLIQLNSALIPPKVHAIQSSRIHTDSLSRQLDSLLLVHIHARIVPLQQSGVHSLCFSV